MREKIKKIKKIRLESGFDRFVKRIRSDFFDEMKNKINKLNDTICA